MDAVNDILILADLWRAFDFFPYSREGVQNKLPQEEPLRHVNYFEREAIETLKAQEKRWHYSTFKEFKLGALHIMSYYQT